MASTPQKTVLKRFNGTEWDPVYLATGADIAYLTKEFAVTPSESGFTDKEVIPAETSVSDLLERTVNSLAYVTLTVLPGLKDGSGITSIPADKIDGTIGRENLPKDIGGKKVTVADADAVAELTSNSVNPGDIVVTEDNGTIYYVTGFGEDGKAETVALNDGIADGIHWADIQDKPTTVVDSGLTDAVSTDMLVEEVDGEAVGKIVKVASDQKLHVSITGDAATLGGYVAEYFATKTEHDELASSVSTNTQNITQNATDIKNFNAEWIKEGTIPLERLPHTALERVYPVQTTDELKNLTTEQVQNGDTVRVIATKVLYLVTDDEKLGTDDYMQGLCEYTAGIAGAVEWSGVLNTPKTLVGYGITDAIATSDLVEQGGQENAGKVLKLDSDGKLNADVLGHTKWDMIEGKPEVSAEQIQQAVTAATHANREVLDKLASKMDEQEQELERLTYNGKEVAYTSDISAAGSGLKVVDQTPEDAEEGEIFLVKIPE